MIESFKRDAISSRYLRLEINAESIDDDKRAEN